VELAALAGRDPMIDLQLQDWWSRQRLTQLSYPNLSLSGASVSLRVILEPFKNVGAIWYSKIYGEYQDNVLLLACSPDLEGLSDRVRCLEQSPIQRLCRENFSKHFTEYLLTDAVAYELEIRFEGKDFLVVDQERLGNRVVHQIYIHDNCFFKPVEDDLLSKIIGCVLEQHSFYLGQEIDWSEISARLTDHLLTSSKIEIQSDPKRQHVWIPQLEEKSILSDPFFKKLSARAQWLLKADKPVLERKKPLPEGFASI
jgi:hypothetical protein